MFRNSYDQCIAIFNDGFVTDKRGTRLFTIVHIILLNQAPNKRYKDENTLQIAILPGPKKPASFNFSVSVILAEIHSLSTYGMIVKTPDNEIIRSKVYCLIFGGDTLGKLSTFSGPVIYGYDELHGLARGVASELYEMLTVDLSSNNKKFYYTYPNGDFEIEEYPFFIPKEKSREIGEGIEKTKQYIPVTFDGSFQDIIYKIRGTRVVDYLDIALVSIEMFLN